MSIDWSKYGGSGTATTTTTAEPKPPPRPATAASSSRAPDWSKYGGTSTAAPSPDSSNPIVGTAQKVGRGLGSALGTVGNALDLPLAAAENVLTGKGLGRIPEDLAAGMATGGVSGALSNVAENDVYFRKGSLQRVVEDPGASESDKSKARFFLTHPSVAGATDFATEFANPSNLIAGGVGRVAGAVGRIPQVAQGLDELQASTRVGSRFAGLRVAGRDVARQQNPTASAAEQHQAAQRAEQWGRRVINAGGVADEGAYRQAMSDFGNLTIDQQKEVVHRAQGNVTQDFGPETNATIDKNAQSVVKNIWQATRDQMQQGVISPSKVYGAEEMFPGVFSDITTGATRRGLGPGELDTIAERARTGERPEHEGVAGMNNPDLTPDNAERMADRDELGRATNDQINERADMLAKYLASDEPPAKKVSFFPMAGAFNQPGRDEEYLDFLDHHMGGGPGKIAERKGTAGLNAPSRTHQTLLDAQVNSKVGLRDDWSPAESYYRFLAQRQKNVELEKAMTDLMGTGMAKPAAERTAGDRFANVKDIQSTRMFGSPVLKETAAHQHVVNFLEEVGATKGEASSFAHATTALGKIAQAAAPAYQASQSILRQAVIANPIVHAGWNLMGQYLAAGGDIRYLGGVNEAIAHDAERYGAITSRGAPRSLAGGSAIDLASRPVSDLNPLEKVQRGAAAGQEWNAKVVFDQAERRYSSALYQTFIKRGMAPEEAGNRVRQALGDYANVANAGVDKVFKQAFFFYPWLKTILPFWIKTGLTKPQTWNPITAGIATHNELAGDPNAGTSNVSPFTLYTGSDAGGRPTYFSVPVVSRILGQIGDLVGGALTNNREEAAKGFKSLLLNRLNPAVGAGLSAGQSVVAGTDQPEGPLGYAPVLERLKSGLAGLGEFIPAPVKGAYDAAQVLLGHQELNASAIAGELVGGTGYVSTTPAQKMAASHIRGRFYRIINAALKRDDRASAWAAYQGMQQALQKAGLAHDQPKRNPEKADETNPLPQGVPEGASPLSATTEAEPAAPIAEEPASEETGQPSP